MAPKTFENRLCGLSLDMFNKDYVHENLWDVEHTDAEKRVNFKNNLKLSKNGDMLGSTLFKGDCGVVHAELMLQNAGNNHVEASAVNSSYKPLALHAKYAFDAAKKSNSLTMTAEHTLPWNVFQFKLMPCSNMYSAFSLFTYKANCWQLNGGAEVNGKRESLYSNHVFGLGYRNNHMGKTYVVSARMLGDQATPVKSIVGNAYAGTLNGNGNVQTALSVAVEHMLDDASTKLKFAGLWHISDGYTPAYVKAKCDSDGQVAVTLFQRFNQKLAAAVGVNFNAKENVNPINANYGLKFFIS